MNKRNVSKPRVKIEKRNAKEDKGRREATNNEVL